MAKYLLCILIVIHSSFGNAQKIIRDVLNGTEVRYDSDDTESGEMEPVGMTEQESFRIDYLVIEGDETPQLKLLNATLKSTAEQLVKNPESRRQFDTLFYQSVKHALNDYVREGEMEPEDVAEYLNYEPRFKRIYANVLSLCNDILVVSFDLDYESFLYGRMFEDEVYSVVRCFDLKTGKEIDKRKIMLPERKKEFETLVRQRIPERFQGQVSQQELENAEMFFSGAAFYCILQGSVDAAARLNEGLPSVHIRLALEEVQPFLNIKGPYGIYLNHVAGVPGEKQMQEMYSGHPDMLSWEKDLEIDFSKDFARANVKKVTCRQVSEGKSWRTGKLYEYHYDGQGKKTLELRFSPSYSESSPSDSVIFAYHSNGHLKSIYRYKPRKLKTYFAEEAFIFDERGNLLQEIEFHEEGEKSVVNYVYIGNRVIADFHLDYPDNLVFDRNSVRYAYYYPGRFNVLSMDEMHPYTRRAEKRENQVLFFTNEKLNNTVQYENGKIASITSPGKEPIKARYNDRGQLLTYESNFRVEYTYNDRQLPSLIAIPQHNLKYEFSYE